MSLVNELYDRYMAELTTAEVEHPRVPIARAIFDARRVMVSQSSSMPPAAPSPAVRASEEAPRQWLQFGAMPPPSERSNPYEDMTARSSPLPGFGYTRTPPERCSEAEIAANASLSAAMLALPLSTASRASDMAHMTLGPTGLGAQASGHIATQLDARSGDFVPATLSLSVAMQVLPTSSASPAGITANTIPAALEADAQYLGQPTAQLDEHFETSIPAALSLPVATPAASSASASPGSNMAPAILAPLQDLAQSPEQAVLQPEASSTLVAPEGGSLLAATSATSISPTPQASDMGVATPTTLDRNAQTYEEASVQPGTQWQVGAGSDPVASGLRFGAMPSSTSLLRDGTTPALLWQVEKQFQDGEVAGEQTRTEPNVGTVTRDQRHTLHFGSMISPFADETPTPASTSPGPQESTNNVNTLSHDEAVSKVLHILAEKHNDNYAEGKREIIRRARKFYKDRDTSDLPPRKQARKITGPAYAICQLLRCMPREDLMQVLEEAFMVVGTIAESGAKENALPDGIDHDTTPKGSLPPQKSPTSAAKAFSDAELAIYKAAPPIHLKDMGLATYSRIPEDLYHTDTVKLARQFLDDTLADSGDAMEALEEAFDRLNRQRGFKHSGKGEFPPIRKATRELVKVFKGVPTGARNAVLDVVHMCCGGDGLQLQYWHARDGETEEERLAREEEGRG